MSMLCPCLCYVYVYVISLLNPFQVSMTCEPGCGEMEEFMVPASTVTSITLHVEEMCQPGEAGLDELQVIGGFVERGKPTATTPIVLALCSTTYQIKDFIRLIFQILISKFEEVTFVWDDENS